MRILITADAVGGVWHYATTLASTLAESHGMQVMLAICGPEPSPAQLSSFRVGSWAGGGSTEITHLPVPLEWQPATDQTFAAARQRLLDLALHWRAHVLHVNEHHLGEIANSGMPVVVVSHSDLCSWRANVLGEVPPLVDNEYLHRAKIGLAAASSVVAPSTFVADALCRWLGFTDVVRVIPNGVAPHPGSLTTAHTIDALMAGRLWDPAKNLSCFRDAVAGIGGRVFAASGPLEAPDAPPRKPPPGNLRYTGMLSHGDFRMMLARSRLLVSPALYDPFGLVVAEAAFAGSCLVLSDIPSYRALWQDTAAYFNPNDPSTLRALVTELLNDVEQRRTLVEAARTRARTLFTAERMAGAYAATYQRLALRYGMAP